MNWLEKATEAGVDGFLHCDELERLVELATDRDVLEIGSFKGLSAWGMVHTAKHLVACDTFCADTNGQTQLPGQTTYHTFCKNLAPFWDKVTCLPFDSEHAEFHMGKDASFDMIFVDAMHTYEDCLADLKRWWPRLRDKGVMLIHDYGHHDFPGVKQAADEMFGETTPAFVTVTLREVWKYAK